MSLDTDDEILQDFIVEAGEILELLSEQLVELESRTDDDNLLNAIFRGFHTVKGGAGFLSLNNLVNVCHIAENVFDLLRQHKRSVDAELMDVILKTLDTVNDMFAEIRNGVEPSPAEDILIQQLTNLAQEEGSEEAPPPPPPTLEEQASPPPPPEPTSESEPPAEPEPAPPPPEPKAEVKPEPESKPEPPPAASTEEKVLSPVEAALNGEGDDITEEEFENLLDALHGPVKAKPQAESTSAAPVAAAASDSDEITEDEFEALLDELSGGGGSSPAPAAPPVAEKPAEPEVTPPTPVAEDKPQETKVAPAGDRNAILEQAASGSDTIEDDEFEALLDQLAGSGPAPTPDAPPAVEAPSKETSKAPTEEVKPPPKPEKVEEPKPAATASKPEPVQSQPTEVKGVAERAKAADKKVSKESGVAAETTVRVDTSRLDEIMNMVGELVLVRNRLVKLKGDSNDESMAKAVSNLDVVTADLQMAVMKTRMQPIKKVFGRFPRVVRDLARSLKKEVSLEMEGEETDLDKNLVEALSDPLVHLVRNSVDHGIEDPDVREEVGKSRLGRIVLAAEQAGDHILLSISDDGKGMDAEMLRKSAVEKGLMDEDAAARLDTKDCYNLIFMPGFSTKTEISDISGRGVGMDVVKTKISQLNGTIEIDSKKGAGSRINIKVPLTLAILPTLMVIVGDQTFALPLTSVNEIFNLDLSKTNVVDGQLVIIVREKAVPLFYLRDWLADGMASKHGSGQGHVVIVSVGTQRIGFVVDGLLGQEEVVIKALGEMLQGTAGMAGATITGDGKIAMILDVPTLLQRYV